MHCAEVAEYRMVNKIDTHCVPRNCPYNLSEKIDNRINSNSKSDKGSLVLWEQIARVPILHGNREVMLKLKA